MSTTSTSTAASASASSGFLGLLNGGTGVAQADEGQNFYTLLASIYTAAASFGVQVLIFMLLRMRLTRIYGPKSYLVAERERVPTPPSGPYKWLVAMFKTPNSTFIRKCGLDAYFFLRYLRMLLKIFIPMAALILPILLPINYTSGNGTVSGVDQLGWQNVDRAHTDRLWAHLVLSIISIFWVLYVIYKELRSYIRIRQAYLTSPEHRLRASATTVLVSGIPQKWLTVAALDGLYDVFPGGIRNIWINRNFDELADKVKQRHSIAHDLESAETALIRNCIKKHQKAEEKKAKAEGRAKKSKVEKQHDTEDANQQAEQLARGNGVSSGNPHQTPHNVHEVLDEMEHEEHGRDHSPGRRFRDPLAKLGQGFGAIGNIGRQFVGGVTNDVGRVIRNVNETVDAANNGLGFVTDPSLLVTPSTSLPKTSLDPGSAHRSTRSVQGAPSTPERPTDFRKSEDVGLLERSSPEVSLATPLTVASMNADDHDRSPLRGNGKIPAHSIAKPRIRLEETDQTNQSGGIWAFMTKNKKDPAIPFPSPQPHTAEGEEFPLNNLGHPKSPALNVDTNHETSKSKSTKFFSHLAFWKKTPEEEKVVETYPPAYDEACAADEQGEPVWKTFMEPKDRDTLREPLFAKSWFPRLPFLGKKIDKIYYLRKELARLNVEIEHDQKNPEKYPFMNSAFIQFNHQVAAHMACQSISHHVPQHMTPRLVEISPGDVLWDNMSMKWWERYVRTAIVFAIAVGLIILYAVPVTFTGLLSQLNTLGATYSRLDWLTNLPTQAKSIFQGVVPPLLLSAILSLIPIIFRVLVKHRGVPTGSDRECGVQDYYFAFLFIQVFLVVTLSTGIINFFESVGHSNASQVPTLLAKNLPKASNYFFSYLIVQALSNSAGALVQVFTLIKWFLWAPLNDSTARQKWRRQTKLQNVQWGSFFPPFTNFAVIGLVFSTIAPLIMIFNLVVFSLYWITQRYNILYVYQFRHDTGGLLFPKAINQLMVGVYTMEIALIGLFFLAQNDDGDSSAYPQGIIMIVALVLTAIYHWLLTDAFRPLFRYLPITLEDEAVIRDEEFARAQSQRFERLTTEKEEEDDDIHSVLEDRERRSAEQTEFSPEEERRRLHNLRRSHLWDSSTSRTSSSALDAKPSPTWAADRWRPVKQPAGQANPAAAAATPQQLPATAIDPESQQAIGDVLYSGFSDELEDLTPSERDLLIRYAFQHAAVRARRPVVWIPRDGLGISDDEIARCKQMSTVVERVDGMQTEKSGGSEGTANIWISNEGTAVDAKGRVVFRRSPPDFANVDLIAL